ncbi:YqaA family protein [Gimibacter soli]|uniref:DedA family protein n=1 Tax=Gimibacter soli TaxID=3024400 RepID=A0AAF0BM35_9PROT|nr:YqaA family protein [Gimibacter soli]WCL54977.1 DedA family protein [Gimibacter soli]
MLKRLYDWSMDRVARPSGEKWLAGLSFAEASFFPIPPDILLMPMIIADRSRAWRLALIATIASVIGAGLGYLIGHFLYEAVALPLIELYGYAEKFSAFEAYYAEYGVLIVLIGGLTPIPFKVITIASGVAGLDPLLFMLSCIPARAPRFFAEALLLWKFGPPIRAFVEKRLSLVFTLFVALLIGGFVALKFV